MIKKPQDTDLEIVEMRQSIWSLFFTTAINFSKLWDFILFYFLVY